MKKQLLIEESLARHPIFQYGFLETGDLEFKEEVRQICKQECDRYNTSWSCPPAVGTVKECKEKCSSYDQVLFFSTLAEVEDTANLEESLKTKGDHERIVHEVCQDIRKAGMDIWVLSSDSCALCETCTWPDQPCRYPLKMFPCIESHGILVTSAAEKLAMDFYYDNQTVVWFAMIFFS